MLPDEQGDVRKACLQQGADTILILYIMHICHFSHIRHNMHILAFFTYKENVSIFLYILSTATYIFHIMMYIIHNVHIAV
jgi:hypothetical protein